MNTGKLIFSSLVVALNINLAFAQTNMSHNMSNNMNHEGNAMHGISKPTLPGQDAFGAIQEVISILEADPATDWSKVNISALREHLVDMNRLVMEAKVEEKIVDNGLEITISDSGSSLLAIQRMVPAHASVIDNKNGWKVSSEKRKNGAILMVTSGDAMEVTHIRGLGFFGLMATGSHHQRHHLAMARGEGMHGE